MFLAWNKKGWLSVTKERNVRMEEGNMAPVPSPHSVTSLNWKLGHLQDAVIYAWLCMAAEETVRSREQPRVQHAQHARGLEECQCSYTLKNAVQNWNQTMKMKDYFFDKENFIDHKFTSFILVHSRLLLTFHRERGDKENDKRKWAGILKSCVGRCHSLISAVSHMRKKAV